MKKKYLLYKYMTNIFFNFFKRFLPKISPSEMQALKSGTVSIDREIMLGKLSTEIKKSVLNNNEAFYVENTVNDIVERVGDNKFFIKSTSDENTKWCLNPVVDSVIKDHKAFSLIIPEKYGGWGMSVEAQSRILSKLASANPGLAVTIMVPNSLSVAEILLKDFGSEEQKNYYLPKLSSTELIPCFGLTGPKNGSDALGSLDKGKIVGDSIIANIDKRYITLAPIASCIGIAIDVENKGPTLVICTPDMIPITKRHDVPCDFPNGVLRGEVKIPLKNVIGEVGEGWVYLMECLASGRGVSLPASSLGPAIASTYGIQGYSRLRNQFNIPLVKMQGVQEKLSNMMYDTILIDSGVRYMNSILDSGEKPAVLSAILKQQSTERARNVVINGMDVYGGSGIVFGENNFLNKFYKSMPVSITVEGSNTLTRSLIIFGQGLNKSHPHISNLVESLRFSSEMGKHLEQPPQGIDKFKKDLTSMVLHSLRLFLKSSAISSKRIMLDNIPFLKFNFHTSNIWDQNLIMFANMSNIICLMGGSLKKEQGISGKMADLFSYCYLSQAILWDYKTRGLENHISQNIVLYKLNKEYCNTLSDLLYLIRYSDSSNIGSLSPLIKLLLTLSIKNLSYTSNIFIPKGGSLPQKGTNIYEKPSEYDYYMSELMFNDNNIKSHFENQIILDSVLQKIKKANEISTTGGAEYEKLVNEIIQVGETTD